MFRRLVLPAVLVILGFGSTAAQASWPAQWSRVSYLDENQKKADMGYYGPNVNEAWDDVNARIAEMTGKKVADVTVSPEYITYVSGAAALLAPAVYTDDPNKIPPFEERGTVEHPWIVLVQPQDTTEANCLKISVSKGKAQGCGDVWQKPITDDALACFDGETYIRCHLDCMQKLHNLALDYKPGACAKK